MLYALAIWLAIGGALAWWSHGWPCSVPGCTGHTSNEEWFSSAALVLLWPVPVVGVVVGCCRGLG